MRLPPAQRRRVIGPLRLNVLHEQEGVEKPPWKGERGVENRNIPRLNFLYFQGVGKGYFVGSARIRAGKAVFPLDIPPDLPD